MKNTYFLLFVFISSVCEAAHGDTNTLMNVKLPTRFWVSAQV
jgi:hypothetical protein